MQERNCITGFCADATVQNVVHKGVMLHETRGDLHEWLQMKSDNQHAKGAIIRLYHNSVYFFASHTLLTTYPLPDEFQDNMKENLCPRAYIKYTYRKRDLKGLTDSEKGEKLLSVLTELFILRGVDVLPVSIEKIAVDAWVVYYVTNTKGDKKTTHKKDADTVGNAFGQNIRMEHLKDENGKTISRDAYSDKKY